MLLSKMTAKQGDCKVVIDAKKELILSELEVLNVLAGLRCLQDHVEAGTLPFMPNFDENEPLSSQELDRLCERFSLG